MLSSSWLFSLCENKIKECKHVNTEKKRFVYISYNYRKFSTIIHLTGCTKLTFPCKFFPMHAYTCMFAKRGVLHKNNGWLIPFILNFCNLNSLSVSENCSLCKLNIFIKRIIVLRTNLNLFVLVYQFVKKKNFKRLYTFWIKILICFCQL